MTTRLAALRGLVHPALVAFPLTMFGAGVLFDIAYLLTANPALADVAFWAIGIGILGGAAASALDLLTIQRQSRVRGGWRPHDTGNAVVVVVFALSWVLRAGDATHAPDAVPALLALAGAGIALGLAWLEGEMAHRVVVAPDDDAVLGVAGAAQGRAMVEVETGQQSQS